MLTVNCPGRLAAQDAGPVASAAAGRFGEPSDAVFDLDMLLGSIWSGFRGRLCVQRGSRIAAPVHRYIVTEEEFRMISGPRRAYAKH